MPYTYRNSSYIESTLQQVFVSFGALSASLGVVDQELLLDRDVLLVLDVALQISHGLQGGGLPSLKREATSTYSY